MKRNSQLILDIVNASRDHLTAEQIFLAAKHKSPKIALSTVYNNLAYLTAEGAVRRLSIQGSPDLYDRAVRHDHLICSGCGKLADIHLPDLTPMLERETGFPIAAYDLNIRYLCPACQGKPPV